MTTENTILKRRTFLQRTALAALAAPCFTSLTARAAEPGKPGKVPLRVAIITGGHPYDVPNFHKLFRALPRVDAYIQNMEDFSTSPETVRDAYDVVLFYIMLMGDPKGEKGPSGKPKAVLEHLGVTEQGIVVLHHALLAYPKWPIWNDLVGIADRKFGYHHNQQIHINVINPEHPITRNMKSWDMLDETYTMADAGEGSEVLLTVDHPQSMKTIGWTRQYKKSRVFCFESGHDNQTWVDPNFREVLRRGIHWCARRETK